MGKVCLNPDCQHPISDDHNYCDETCLRWHLGIKKLYRRNIFEVQSGLKPNPTVQKTSTSECIFCKKSIIGEQYFQYHGLRFCNKACYVEYKKTNIPVAPIEDEKSESFTEWAHRRQREKAEKATPIE
jgi:hypothetical protein